LFGFPVSGIHGYNTATLRLLGRDKPLLLRDVNALRNKNVQIERALKVSMGLFPSSINILGMMRKTTINSEFPRKASHRKLKIEKVKIERKLFLPFRLQCLQCIGDNTSHFSISKFNRSTVGDVFRKVYESYSTGPSTLSGL